VGGEKKAGKKTKTRTANSEKEKRTQEPTGAALCKAPRGKRSCLESNALKKEKGGKEP